MIHHSDRGSQYCAHLYINELKKHQIKISMAVKGNCYENAVAERVNGILKGEFELDQTFKNIPIAYKTVKEAIFNYNYLRPHFSLQLKTPASLFDTDFKKRRKCDH